MAIHWQIPFKSLRVGTNYTVNIYDSSYSGSPIKLKPGANPFTTQESDDDDMFIPIRTHTGYLRIVDDGKAYNANNEEIDWNWKDLLPATDTDRPVTLTDGSGTIVWQGFMQSQNFGGVLYGNPQEREFPIQCPLAILEGTDINYQHTEIENFAYLLQRVVNTIDTVSGSTIHINNIYVQGDADAQAWLLKRIDWQAFAETDSDGNPSARFNLYQCLEDMCRFWGWTARTYHNDLYLTCADDSGDQTWLTLTRGNLDTMAAGSTDGTTGGAFSELDFDLLTDIFASTEQNDYRQRGANKAMVNVNISTAENNIMDPMDQELRKTMGTPTWNDGYTVGNAHYSQDVLSMSRLDLIASAVSGCAAFNILYHQNGEPNYGWTEMGDVISIKKTYDGSVFMSLETKYEHCYHDGFFRIFADTFRDGEKYEDGRFYAGNPAMIMRFGIGKSRASAQWWDGRAWQGSMTTFLATIGNKKPELFTRYETGSGFNLSYEESSIFTAANLSGRIYIDLLGSNDSRIENISGQKRFDLKGFRIEFRKNDTVSKTQFPNSGWYDVQEVIRPTKYVYKSSNNNNVREDFNADCIYGGDDRMNFSPGILINPDGSYMTTVPFGITTERPEQHLADRVTSFWATAKRKLTVDLRADKITEPSPMNRVTLDSTTGHPIAISHEWRDDVTKLTILEL